MAVTCAFGILPAAQAVKLNPAASDVVTQQMPRKKQRTRQR